VLISYRLLRIYYFENLNKPYAVSAFDSAMNRQIAYTFAFCLRNINRFNYAKYSIIFVFEFPAIAL
jgi:hypothetical protein